MRKIIFGLTLITLISCCNQDNQKKLGSESKNLRQITSIAELKLQDKNVQQDADKYEYYFCLYRLNEALKLKENKRLSEIDIIKILTIVDSIYDFNLENKDFSKVKTFDNLYKTDEKQLYEELKNEFYYGDGVQLEQVNSKDNYFDKQDERNINSSLYTFINQRPNISSLEFYYYKVADSLIKLDFSEIEKNTEFIEKKISKIIDNQIDTSESFVHIRTNYLNSIIKQQDGFYFLTFNVEHEGGKDVKYATDGKLQFLLTKEYKIVPNSLKFQEDKNKKLHNL